MRYGRFKTPSSLTRYKTIELSLRLTLHYFYHNYVSVSVTGMNFTFGDSRSAPMTFPDLRLNRITMLTIRGYVTVVDTISDTSESIVARRKSEIRKI